MRRERKRAEGLMLHIERLWRTLQDRLTKELRLASINTLEAANAFLPSFITGYNARFA
jgi:hypothetical protein